jgi:hypothetical protein
MAKKLPFQRQVARFGAELARWLRQGVMTPVEAFDGLRSMLSNTSFSVTSHFPIIFNILLAIAWWPLLHWRLRGRFTLP